MNKDWYIIINGEKVSVSEKIYRAYKRPAWVERKRRKVRAENERSIEALKANGFDIPTSAKIEDVVMDKLLSKNLHIALESLDKKERFIIIGLYFESMSERDVAEKLGITQNTVNYHKQRILNKLKKIL